MFAWLSEYISTIIVAAILLGIVIAIIAGMIRNKKLGKHSCPGCNCGCGSKSACNKKIEFKGMQK